MMASAGRDQRIQLWDLTRGTSAAHLTVPESVEILEWSPDGQSIAALSPRELVAVEGWEGKRRMSPEMHSRDAFS
eukprot:symbB.v1.2.002041.t1/scaffold105.1/size328853/7